MGQRGIPILELDVEYGEEPSGQMKMRVEAFMEMLQKRVKEPAMR
jgi:benzoyl-CoA reductase/2-hydroxyglutaryl-CoA dehydratase subunit BcrC/BadD/HgdB